MTRLIADRLLAQPELPSSWQMSADTARAQHLLRMPAENHIPADIGQIGKVDRFVAPEGFWDAVWSEGRVMEDDAYAAFVAPARASLPIFWLEYKGDPHQAWLIEHDKAICFQEAQNVVFPLGFVSLDVFRERNAFEYGMTYDDQITGKLRENIISFLFSIFAVLAVLSSPAVRYHRVSPNQSAAQRAFARRRLQQGRPIFSYNQVELVIPKTVHYREEQHKTESLAGRRGHMVIGHWRLINGTLEPYWVWIDDHERGDPTRGWIIKERRLVYLGGGIRRGFLIPDYAGDPGERRIAELVL